MNFRQALKMIQGHTTPVDDKAVDRIEQWLVQQNLGDDPRTNERDQARLIVMAQAALEAVHGVPEAGSPIHIALVHLAYWCVDRVMWVSNTEDDAELT